LGFLKQCQLLPDEALQMFQRETDYVFGRRLRLWRSGWLRLRGGLDMKNVDLGLTPITSHLKCMVQSRVARFGVVDAYDDGVGSV
jgi:hypothetical protein